MDTEKSFLDSVYAYHTLSKHTPHRSAPGPGYMDWESQPDPFRTFAGSPQIPLPLVASSIKTVHQALYQPPGTVPSWPLDSRGVAALLELSLGLSAWKAYMDEWWALRCNPSSGNLHPTEGYVILPSLAASSGNDGPALPAGVYHYYSRDHRLEQRWTPQAKEWDHRFAPQSFLLGLSSIHWREAWKYGLRAFRYCQLDIGHVAASVRYAAAALGWQARLLNGPSDSDIHTLLGLNRPDSNESNPPEAEHPDLLMFITCTTTLDQPPPDVALLAESVKTGPWLGKANRLSPQHMHEWPEIDRIAQATQKPTGVEKNQKPDPLPPLTVAIPQRNAAELIWQRRSAQRYDGKTTLSKNSFFRMLDSCLPRRDCPPWDLITGPAHIHLAVMVHRITDLQPGLYMLVRRAEALPFVKNTLQSTFLWQPVVDAPEHLPLFCLKQGDLRASAQHLSCQQEIAADGAFSLGMLAEFETVLAMDPWEYRRLYWEAGMVGQTLYLEAEAEGIRGTGIGCYFDDTFHQMLGLSDKRAQSLYHFTVGGPIADNRLQTLPPYHHLDRT